VDGEPDLCIGGTWRRASDGGTREIVNPATGAVAAVVDEATDADARAAVSAARTAFDDGPWRATTAADRATLLNRIADLLQRDKADLARLETVDTGKTLAESEIDIDDVTSVFRYYARLIGVQSDTLVDVGDPAVVSRVVREPIGVCVLIAPWN
jgi:betaine-aldehyde dehydrogenase